MLNFVKVYVILLAFVGLDSLAVIVNVGAIVSATIVFPPIVLFDTDKLFPAWSYTVPL